MGASPLARALACRATIIDREGDVQPRPTRRMVLPMMRRLGAVITTVAAVVSPVAACDPLGRRRAGTYDGALFRSLSGPRHAASYSATAHSVM